jgi:acetyltransferase
MKVNLKPFFSPSSVAVVGASAEEGKIGNVVIKSLLKNYRGKVFFVNPKYDQIMGMKCYKDLVEIEESIELVVVVVPAPIVKHVIRRAGEVGIKAAIVISGGFSEVGRTDLESEVEQEARRWGIRILGPNTLGVMDLYSGLNTFFLPDMKLYDDSEVIRSYSLPEKGDVALISQSGGLGVTILDYIAGKGIGLRCFIGTGNQADLEVSDFIEYLVDDPYTKLIALYLEGVKDGRRFVRTVWRASRKKPVVALRAGKTGSGRRAAMTHTASMVSRREVYDVAFRRAGIVEAETIEQFFDYIKALKYSGPMNGDRVFILTNGGGAGVVAADACEGLGFNLPFPKGTVFKELKDAIAKGLLPSMTAISNPLDLTGSAGDEEFISALKILSRAADIDGLLLITFHHPPKVTDKVVNVVGHLPKDIPTVVCDVGEAEYAKRIRESYDRLGVPSYPTPERAANALYALRLRARCLTVEKPPAVPPEKDEISWLNDSFTDGVLLEPFTSRLLKSYEIPFPESFLVTSKEELDEGLRKVREPFAMKVVSPEVLHRSDVGGVILNLRHEEAEEAYQRILSSLRDVKVSGILVQEMVEDGIEILVSGFRDPTFGPMITVASGGIYTELLKDYAIDFAPINQEEALSLVKQLRVYKILTGYRGGKSYDVSSLAKVIANTSRLLFENPSIGDVELNPVIVGLRGVKAVDARILKYVGNKAI